MTAVKKRPLVADQEPPCPQQPRRRQLQHPSNGSTASGQRSARHDHISQLPFEIAFHILSLMPYRSLVAMTRVNHYWRDLACQQDYLLWYRLCLRHGYIKDALDTTPAHDAHVARPAYTLPSSSEQSATVAGLTGSELELATSRPSPTRPAIQHSRPTIDQLWAQARRPGLQRALAQSQSRMNPQPLDPESIVNNMANSSNQSNRSSARPTPRSPGSLVKDGGLVQRTSSPSSPMSTLSPSSSVPSSPSSSSPSSSTSASPSSSSPTSFLSSKRPDHARSALSRQGHISHWKDYFEATRLLEREWIEGKPTVKELRGHKEAVVAVKILPMIDKVVSGDRFGFMIIWCPITGTCLRTFKHHNMGVSSFVTQRDLLLSGSWDESIIIWRQQQEPPYIKPLKIIDVGEQIMCMDLTPDLDLAIGAVSGVVKIISVETLTNKGVFRPPTPGLCTAVSLTNTKVEATVGSNYYAWDRSSKHQVAFVGDTHFEPITCMQVDVTKRLLVTGSQDKVRVFSWEAKPMLLRQYGGHRARIMCMTLQDDMILTGSADKSVMITFTDRGGIFRGERHSHVEGLGLPTALSSSTPTPTSVTASLPLPSSSSLPPTLTNSSTSTSSSSSSSSSIQRGSPSEDAVDGAIVNAEPVALAHPAVVNAIDADCSMVVSGADDRVVRIFDFGYDLWRPPTPRSPKLCGQASLISATAPTCVLMAQPSQGFGGKPAADLGHVCACGSGEGTGLVPGPAAATGRDRVEWAGVGQDLDERG
ncbi:hypothetical protein BGW38_001547 [Lunasporangiospora selenospora]|uniref:F-box domain-containing protein n=1 Tax=Lunasporangiospora selenospora TaxID=979761 RepID=A0A9P6FTT2_9FUNG|nr:hypothetical protein BGW38_001547 [Lunasporangiospora selenospora]